MKRMLISPRRLTALVALCGTLGLAPDAAPGHEFWIEPVLGGAEAPRADMRVGQMLAGDALPYLDRIVASARHRGPAGTVEMAGRLGDLPAFSPKLDLPGLHTLTVETRPAYIVFDDLQEFADYLAYEGLSPVRETHLQRGLPRTEIAEEYVRHARTLLQVGPVRQQDRDLPSGLDYELVATQTPFAADAAQIAVRLTWQEVPQEGTQVAVFHRPPEDAGNREVSRRLHRTDADGSVVVDVAAPGTYLLNAVRMQPAEGPGSVVWQSHWASLSFEIPVERRQDR